MQMRVCIATHGTGILLHKSLWAVTQTQKTRCHIPVIRSDRVCYRLHCPNCLPLTFARESATNDVPHLHTSLDRCARRHIARDLRPFTISKGDHLTDISQSDAVPSVFQHCQKHPVHLLQHPRLFQPRSLGIADKTYAMASLR